MAKTQRKRKVRSDRITFTTKQIAQIESLSGVGMTVEEIADYMGVSKATFDRRVAEIPDLKEALRVGRTRAQGAVYRAAYEMATDKKHSDFTKFYMRSRYGWSEKQEIELSGKVGVDPEGSFLDQLKGMSTEELANFVEQGRKSEGDS